jgi:pimeloyl-ACP methyl ester carboxylesterase
MLLLGRDGLNDAAASVPVVEVPSAIGDYTVRYAEGDCPFVFDYDVEPEVLEAITCGYMQVPQDRRAPDGLQIEIAVAIVASRSDEPYADPILYMEGGPGGGALISAGSWLESPLRDERDIIVFDQRGTGFSWPNLGCPELDEVDEWDFDASLIALADCRARLERMGVDLAAYHSATNALDVADLRQVLGLESWNLLGISYGTRLALTVLRDRPEGVRSVILDSVYPPNVDAYVEQALTFGNAINALLDGCAEDRECSAAFPDLRQNFYELLLELDEEPLYFYADEIDTDEDIEVDAYTFVSLLTSALYDTDLIPLLPMLIDDTYYGYYDLLIEEFLLGEDDGGWSRQRPDDAEPVDDGSVEDAQGMFYSVECYEEAAFADLDDAYRRAEVLDPLLAELLLADVAQFLDACAVWLPGHSLARKSTAVHSELPVLLLAGEYDPVTPPAWAKLAAQTLPNHVYVELPRGGHGLTDLDECISNITLAFLAAPTRRISTRCLADSVRPFVVP